MVLTIARQTGWDEQTILWMPLRRSLQYVHASWVAEGVATEWRTATGTELRDADELYQRLHYLTRQSHG